MTIKELKEEIKDLPNDMEIIIQKDSGGNSYSPLYITDDSAVYIAENTYSGECYPTHESAEYLGMEENEYRKILQHPRVLVLVPVN